MMGTLTHRSALALITSLAFSSGSQADAVSEGAYLIQAAGCVACHTDKAANGAYLAGGPALKTEFGTFWGPNITPDSENGLGNWTGEEFRQAMREGLAPDGSHYYPVFPYPSYTKMTDADIDALWAYLQTVPAVASQAPEHDLSFPYSMRFLMSAWKFLEFEAGPVPDDPNQSADWNRGRYLTDALAHCGECHTPRGALGHVVLEKYLSGNPDGPDGEDVPNITPHASGLADWGEDDMITLLVDGMKPDFDSVQGSMEEVIEHGTSNLTEEDLAAIAAYLIAIPALPSALHDH